jgi:dihydroorotase
VFNLPGGTLHAGALGDVTLIDLEARYEVTRAMFLSKAANSPFVGEKLQGRVVTTIVGGAVKHDIRAADTKKRKRK